MVQDLVSILPKKGQTVSIGDEVVVSSKALLEGNITLKERAFVGLGATLGEGCTVEAYGVVAAGAVLPKGTTVAQGQVYAGNPAQLVRTIGPAEREALDEYH